ncbi:MAG: type II toxin-antitoxin system HicA family toxin [Acidobacteriota bacterium]
MKLPRNLSGNELAQTLKKLGYDVTRQTGSHMRLTTNEGGEHHVTVPCHPSLRVGTLSAILAEIADHFGLTREELIETLFQ